ncbi:MAG TPA: tetratricopeptide repeat protein, partial [Candidatus Cloacimonadota bacterium]|nr:tetratricopeptide repeat protein [Candidatus Cloacimonadota bacterium]
DIALTVESPILQAFIFLNRGDESFNYSNFDEAISLYSQGISIISSTDNVNLKSLLLIKISTTYIRKGELAMAYKQLHDVLLITDKHNLLQLRANALTLLGDIENENANYDKAVDYIIQANHIFLDLGDYYNFAVNLNIIGSYYIDSYNEDAMPYLKHAEEISKKHKYDSILSDVLNNIGTILASQQKYNEALDYFYESVECGKKHFNAFNHANTLHNIADTYKELKEYKKALAFYKKGLKIIDKTDDIFSIVGGYISISDFYLRLNNYDKALQYANKVFDAVIELEDPYYLSHFYKIYY